MGIKHNDAVVQVLPKPFTGLVTGFSIDQKTGDKLVHVQAEDGAARYFKEEELKVAEDGNDETTA